MKQNSLVLKLKSLINSFLDFSEVIVLSAFIVILIFTFITKIVVVEGNSMNSTLYNKDKLLITHMFYTPEVDDIVVINSEALNETIVKRVIAVSGQSVSIDYDNETVRVDGKLLNESYTSEYIIDTGRFDRNFYNEETKTYEYVVPENCIFVMGDNRNHSTDSRAFGFVSVSDVVGKVYFRISSPYGDLGFI